MKVGKTLLTGTFLLFISFSTFAQSSSNEGYMTYDQAVMLLTAHQGEFTEKGEFPSIGQQILDARNKKEVSPSTLAYVAGISEESILKIEADMIAPTRDIIAKIEDFLGEEIILIDK